MYAMAQIMTTAQIAETYGVSVRTVMRMKAAGELPVQEKLPGTSGAYLFDPDVVAEVFASRASRTSRLTAASA